jgi:hypothetical protein
MFSARGPVSQRYVGLASMSPKDNFADDTKEVLKTCAMTCLEHWDPAVVAKPCGDAVTDTSAIVLLIFADLASNRIAHDDPALLDKRVDRSGPEDQGRRITSARAERLARKVAVAANEDVRSDLSTSNETTAHKKLDSKNTPSKEAPVALSQQASGLPDTPESKSASALSRSFPTMIPTSCGPSGSSCGGKTAGPGRVLERKIGAEQKGFASSSSPPAFKREAGPHPAAEAPSSAADSIPDKIPSSCGPAGGTCGAADGSGSGSGGVPKRETSAEQEGTASSLLSHGVKSKAKSPPAAHPQQKDEHPPGLAPSSCGFAGSTCGGSVGPASMPPSQATKREAESQPLANKGSRPPVWTPSSCTNPGVTCGLSKGSGKGSETGPPAPYNDWGLIQGSRRLNASDVEV